MNKNFFIGFMTGLLITIFTVVLFFTGVKIYNKIIRPYEPEDIIVTEEIDEDKKKEFNNIFGKLMYLENIIDKYFLEEVDKDKFEDGIYKGFIASLKDPYSNYYTKEEYLALMEGSSGIYYGIGATVSQNAKTGIITIVKPFLKGPAYEAGMLPGDILYKVEGEEVTGVDLSEVVSRMKGPEGTKVSIEVIREGESEPIPLMITRRKIEVETIEYEILDDNIGYIMISEFDEVTVKQFKEAVDYLEAQNISGLIIDLRDNPGGLLSSVVAMLDRIISKGLIVYTEDKNGKREEESATDADEFNKPLVVMINGNSASASEIFAGTIQDYEKGIILGTRSFGKGIVQKIFPIPDNTAIKLTISKYFTPKGRNIHGVGIEPDIEVELNEELRKMVMIPKDKDNQLQEAIKAIKDKIK